MGQPLTGLERQCAVRDGRRIRYRDTGGSSHRTVTLLHPIGLDGSWWADQAEELTDRYRVIAVDLAGHGSTDPLPAARLSSMAADVRAVWEAAHVSTAVVVGVSMGGMVAQQLAVDGAVLDGLVLVCTAASFPDDARTAIQDRAGAVDRLGMKALADRTVERWFSPMLLGQEAAIVESARRQLAKGSPSTHRECWEMISEIDFLPRLGEVTAPTLVVAGEADASIPVSLAQQLAQAIPGAELELVPDGSHMFAFERRGWLARAVSRVGE